MAFENIYANTAPVPSVLGNLGQGQTPVGQPGPLLPNPVNRPPAVPSQSPGQAQGVMQQILAPIQGGPQSPVPLPPQLGGPGLPMNGAWQDNERTRQAPREQDPRWVPGQGQAQLQNMMQPYLPGGQAPTPQAPIPTDLPQLTNLMTRLQDFFGRFGGVRPGGPAQTPTPPQPPAVQNMLASWLGRR